MSFRGASCFRSSAVAALVAALSLAGCDRSEVSRAKKSVQRQLKDPDSAQFREIEVRPDGAVCGEVNARNSYGAMAGFQPFHTYKDGYGAVLMPGDNGDGDIAFYQEHRCVCIDKAIRDDINKNTMEPPPKCPDD